MKSQKSAFLDVARGISAMAVAIGHLRSLFFVDYNEVVPGPNFVIKALYFVTGFGHQAVIVFFVLSGYLIGGSVINLVRSGRWSTRVYAITRLSRLLTVLVPALAVGAILDNLGLVLFGAEGTYSGNASWGNIIPESVSDRNTIAIYLGNAMFLQNVLVPTAGTNSALWSLSNEFSYYFLFMFGVALFHSAHSGLRKVAVAIAAGGFSYLYKDQISGGFHIWLFGLAVLCFESRSEKTLFPWLKYLVVGSGVIGVGILILTRVRHLPGGDTTTGLAVAAILLAGTRNRIPSQYMIGQKYFQKASTWMSEISYTLYATHLPLAAFFCAWQTAAGRLQPNLTNLGKFFAIAVCLLAWSWLLYLIAERHTQKVRSFGIKLFGLDKVALKRTDPIRKAA